MHGFVGMDTLQKSRTKQIQWERVTDKDGGYVQTKCQQLIDAKAKCISKRQKKTFKGGYTNLGNLAKKKKRVKQTFSATRTW